MAARRRVRSTDPQVVLAARRAVDAAKRALGERGPVWWTDGAPDLNRRLAKNSPYADWAAALVGDGPEAKSFGTSAASRAGVIGLESSGNGI